VVFVAADFCQPFSEARPVCQTKPSKETVWIFRSPAYATRKAAHRPTATVAVLVVGHRDRQVLANTGALRREIAERCREG